MIESIAWIVVIGAGIYLLPGVLFALPFVLRGAGRIDRAAVEGSLGFRLLIVPGAIALWPLLLQRWRQSERTEESGR